MKLRLYDIIFVVISIFNIFFSYIFGMTFLTAVLIVFLIILKLTNRIDAYTYLLYSLFVPNKYLQLLSVVLFLAFSNTLFTRKMSKRNFIFITYISIVSIVNCVFYGGCIVGTLFQVGVYYCILRLLDDFDKNILIETTYEVLDKMFFLQVICILIEIMITHETMDALKGTLISAHYLGVFLLIYTYLLYKRRSTIREKGVVFLKLITVVICMYLIDAKHIVVVFIFSTVLSLIFLKVNIKNRFTVTMLLSTAFIGLILWSLNSGAINGFLNHYPILRTYVLNSDYNKKVQFYLNTYRNMIGLNGVFGYGVGQYGSQICISLAKGIIYNWNYNLKSYTYAIAPFAKAIGGIMTEWYTNTGIVISSMVLGYPLVSYIALVGELGIVGLFMFMQILDNQYRHSRGNFILMFLLLTHFDTYFEIPCVFILILIAENVNCKRKNIILAGGK